MRARQKVEAPASVGLVAIPDLGSDELVACKGAFHAERGLGFDVEGFREAGTWGGGEAGKLFTEGH